MINKTYSLQKQKDRVWKRGPKNYRHVNKMTRIPIKEEEITNFILSKPIQFAIFRLSKIARKDRKVDCSKYNHILIEEALIKYLSIK